MKITGDTLKIERFTLEGLYSFNRAFENARGEIGFPIGQVTEVSGPTFCGKSTTVHCLSGFIAKSKNTNVALADFEGFDPEFITDLYTHAGFDGELNVVQKGNDEKTLDAFIDLISEKKKNFGVGIVDSVGAISPISELEGSLGDANMGRRAKLMAQFSRKVQHLLLDEQKTVFMINHVHPNLGSMGTTTPGGETMKYMSHLRLRLKRKEEFPDQSYTIEGKVTKNRYGYRDRIFHLFMLSGKGLHPGLTAMYDCFVLGLAERGQWVKIGDKSHGRLKALVQAGHDGDNTVFEPFLELLRNNGTGNITPTDDTETELDNPED